MVGFSLWKSQDIISILKTQSLASQIYFTKHMVNK
jgi:hypothetical protein